MKKNIVSAVMRAMGRKGGKRSLETMTPEGRVERAKKAGGIRESTGGEATPETHSDSLGYREA